MKKPFYVSEENNSFDSSHFVDSICGNAGVKYDYKEFGILTEDERSNLSEMEKMVAKKPGVLGVVRMDNMLQADVSTRNGTVYPSEILKREIDKYNKSKVEHKAAYMAADHPGWEDGWRVKFANSSGYLLTLEYDEETGIVSGSAVIIDKGPGQDVSMTFKAGGRVGVSSRGFGSTEEGDIDGINGFVSGRIIQDDYVLEGFDFVLDPSSRGAGVDTMTEDKNHNGESKNMNKEKLKKDHPEVFEAVFGEGKAAALEELTSEKGSFVSKDLHESTVADLKEAKESVEESNKKATEQDDKIKTLEESHTASAKELDELKKNLEESKAAAEKAAAEAFVSESLATHPKRDQLRDRLTDADLINTESAKSALEREQKYLTALGIPASPLAIEDNKRTGKKPGEDDQIEESEDSPALNNLFAISGRKPV